MIKNFDMKTIGFISTFENITKNSVLDCIFDEKSLYFLVEPGKAGTSIGKNGKNIKKLQRIFNKNIRIFEYNEDSKKFIKNMIPEAETIEIKDGKAFVTLDSQTKGKVIGRNGYNINKTREILKRNSKINKLEIK